MEDARVAPHSPRSFSTNFDVNSESGLIHDNILRAEPLSSGRNRNISMPIQKLVQSSQRRGVGNMPKPSEGGHELLLTHKELSGSGEEDRTLIRAGEGVGNDSSFGDRRPSGVHQLQTSSRSGQKKPKGPQKKQKGPKNNQGKGKGKANWHRAYPQGYRIAKLEPSAMDSVFNMARNLMEFKAKEQERMNRTFPQK
ncbi:hypothetical protein O181_090746 [Austropuccinia psidii MF-1]|uniref:Uncharacterized protein n=1 Tax=Austropuccinia psidii MF-1 TaxID=1389203 RepID=A0A9Q3P900_9BASI|nr:hypothetical protein [Austropuccinia psidii MF-1]